MIVGHRVILFRGVDGRRTDAPTRPAGPSARQKALVPLGGRGLRAAVRGATTIRSSRARRPEPQPARHMRLHAGGPSRDNGRNPKPATRKPKINHRVHRGQRRETESFPQSSSCASVAAPRLVRSPVGSGVSRWEARTAALAADETCAALWCVRRASRHIPFAAVWMSCCGQCNTPLWRASKAAASIFARESDGWLSQTDAPAGRGRRWAGRRRQGGRRASRGSAPDRAGRRRGRRAVRHPR